MEQNTYWIDNGGNVLEYSNGKKLFNMIDNYIYLYHTDTLVVIPTYPENITDSMGVTFNSNTVLSRSAPIFAYANSGPRSLSIQLRLQREMMDMVNWEKSNYKIENGEDYTDFIIRNLQSMAVPKYSASEKMVDPPLIAVRFGNEIFCKGVVTGSVQVSFDLPILGGRYNDKYSIAQIGFTVSEVDPYGADQIAMMGGYRGIEPSLERKLHGLKPVSYINDNVQSSQYVSGRHTGSSGRVHGGSGGTFNNSSIRTSSSGRVHGGSGQGF